MDDDVRAAAARLGGDQVPQAGDGAGEGVRGARQNAGAVRTKYADRAEPEIWYGIIVASYAGAKGGLGALSLAKDAKQALEHALAIDPKALAGSAYTSLGSLYYQVPGLADRIRRRQEGARAARRRR